MPVRIRLRLWWATLWVRKDEFHWSLEMDADALRHMTPDQRYKYMQDLFNRRKIAHGDS